MDMGINGQWTNRYVNSEQKDNIKQICGHIDKSTIGKRMWTNQQWRNRYLDKWPVDKWICGHIVKWTDDYEDLDVQIDRQGIWI